MDSGQPGAGRSALILPSEQAEEGMALGKRQV